MFNCPRMLGTFEKRGFMLHELDLSKVDKIKVIIENDIKEHMDEKKTILEKYGNHIVKHSEIIENLLIARL